MEEILSIVNSIRNLFITGDEDNDDLCVVCYVNLRNITFYPCKHDNCCERCYLQLTPKKCPYCRADIAATNPIIELPEVELTTIQDESFNSRVQAILDDIPGAEYELSDIYVAPGVPIRDAVARFLESEDAYYRLYSFR